MPGSRPYFVLATTVCAALLMISNCNAQESSSPVRRKCFNCNEILDCRTGSCDGDVCVNTIVGNYVSKGCANRSFDERLVMHCSREKLFGIPSIICYCDDVDYCNHSRPSRAQRSFIFISLFLPFLLYFFYDVYVS